MRRVAALVVVALASVGCGDRAGPATSAATRAAEKTSASPAPAPTPAPAPVARNETKVRKLGWKKLGDVSFPSKRALAIDPSYVPDAKLGVTIPLDRADWEAWYALDPREENRVAQLAIVRAGARPDGVRGDAFGGALETVGVDSGQAGFFDPAHAGKDDEAVAPFADLKTKKPLARWYLMCCARTLGKRPAGLVPFGVVSSSGWGDGGYEVFVRRDAAGAVEVVRIDFIPDEEGEPK